SASEVLAAALKESAGAVLIGETTFGKGTVQVNYNKATGDGSTVKMTIAKWLTPSGEWVNETGVQPDIEVAQPDYFAVARIARNATLKRDMIGGIARSLQMLLCALGHEPHRRERYSSDRTQQALAASPAEAKLPVTGEADEATVETLERAVI